MESPLVKILLADDDETDRLLFVEAFEELKIKTTVHTVNNGAELMDFLTENDEELPHLIFLDLNMPRKNGLECLAEIRQNKNYKDISIAIYSTSSSKNDIENTYMGGANIYIKKPSDFNELKLILARAVKATLFYKMATSNRENFILKL